MQIHIFFKESSNETVKIIIADTCHVSGTLHESAHGNANIKVMPKPAE